MVKGVTGKRVDVVKGVIADQGLILQKLVLRVVLIYLLFAGGCLILQYMVQWLV